ncbi:ThiF family adenylyltransferase [Terribacillus sp. 7520-G]|uniref:ThiF family adenylyltransferase n=1 Tax=Terribacillus TaxID=459532 RepID=UPI000BA5555F|nr:ThiF family adenylyltransferase [Terribacillus sp. 7520-G]PAD37588.1 heme biosynthesis protein HemY [Terribacillus sp. 7520-G]
MINKYDRPRIKAIYPLYKLNKNEFRIGAQLGITAELGDPDGYLWELASRLDGRKVEDVIKEMVEIFPELSEEDVLEGISILDNEEFLEETLNGHESTIQERYIANVNYFSRYTGTDGNRYDYQKKINETTILLLGLGGGGSNILTLLSGLGPKKIIIVDYDNVEESNLGRQLLYKESDIGLPKCEVAAKAISEMNSHIIIEAHNKKIETTEDVLQFTEGVDLVICAIDEPPFEAQRTVNQAVIKANIPCVFGAHQVSRGRVFTVIPGKTGCFDCLNLHFSVNDPKFIEQFVGFRNINFAPPSIAYAPAIYQLTSAIVDEAVRVITGYAQPRSLSTQYEINFEDGSSFTHPSWDRYDECPTCGKGRTEDWEIFRYYERTNKV